ncbi:glycosyltransferase family 4 protein [Sinomonas sp. JGH33]|uniref:D-inositol 3-phosphate glycosyltransferase n=1 Tax=Sinomonas terricola TaxID=3110330 RepID=A0ABU5TBC5_9MICC|nr:glycosyltransferase family 4 protein [Sinomonas sp. JGH33]MEA5456990.1 glycosyltransferase family 4 protein [Sinomonas sp. JGH33]
MTAQDYAPHGSVSEPSQQEPKSSLSVLIVGMHYSPEPTGNAPYTTKLAEGLSAMGHRVEVITGYPHYPHWRIADGYSGLSTKETVNGVTVRRFRHSVPSTPRTLNRLLMEVTFGLHAMLRRWGKHDVVLVVSPALFSAVFAVSKARIKGTPVGVWVQDLYSRGLSETGGSTTATWLMKTIESKVLGACTGVTVIHGRFRNYVVNELAVHASKVNVIRNWTHIHSEQQFDRDAVRGRLGWAPDETVALHAGNMGVKQGLENVVEAARLADAFDSHVRFVLLGEGNRREALQEAGRGVASLSFLKPLSDLEYSEALRAADVLIVNERPDLREMSVPSKLTSYFAAGRPVVAATHPESATADEIRASGAGITVDPERPSVLLRAVEKLALDPGQAETLGSAGPSYAEQALSAAVALDAYSRWLADLSGLPSGPS